MKSMILLISIFKYINSWYRSREFFIYIVIKLIVSRLYNIILD
jgi:hypothetical protein